MQEEKKNNAYGAERGNKKYHEDRSDKAYQAYRILQITFILAPIIAGLDKFAYLLTDWTQYLAPAAANVLSGYSRVFLYIVGIVEIIVGIGMIFKPKVFAYITALWLLLIIINLLLTGKYFDIALRDLGLLLAAVALGRLSQRYNL